MFVGGNQFRFQGQLTFLTSVCAPGGFDPTQLYKVVCFCEAIYPLMSTNCDHIRHIRYKCIVSFWNIRIFIIGSSYTSKPRSQRNSIIDPYYLSARHLQEVRLAFKKAHLFSEINFGFYISIEEHLVSVFFPKSFFDNRPQYAERRKL